MIQDQAFRDFARESGWKNLDRTTTRYLENADPDVMENPEEELLKLWPTTVNRDIFRNIVLSYNTEKVESQFPLTKLPRKHKYEPRSNLVEAYLFFSESIRAWVRDTAELSTKTLEECAFALLQAIQQDFCVVQIVLSEGDDSQEIFYSLNSQAKPLSQSDLLRSLIFMRAEKEKLNRDALFTDYWGKFETKYWSTEITRGANWYSRLDLGMRYFLIAKTGGLVDARRVSEDYRRWITSEAPRYSSVREELADFAKHADCFKRYDDIREYQLACTDIRRVILDFDISTALPLLIYLEIDAGIDQNELSACQTIIESFIVRRAITGEETKEHNKFFVEVIGALRATPDTPETQVLLTKLQSGVGSTRRWPSDNDIIEAVLSKPAYKSLATSALRLVLERIETAHRTKKAEHSDIPASLQIEHVLPESWWSHWPIDGATVTADDVKYPFLADESIRQQITFRSARLQTLGNLTLVNKFLNPAASNSTFATKKREYANSVLNMNRYFDPLASWDEHEISLRGRALGEMICQIWPKPQLR